MPDGGWDAALAWLHERLNEDEEIAGRAGAHQPDWTYDRETFTVSSGSYAIAASKDRSGTPINDVDGAHIASNDPAAVLRRVESDRRLLAWVVETYGWAAENNLWSYDEWQPLKLMALRYVEVPGFPEVLRLDQTEAR